MATRPGIILQARMASSRLPGKALERIGSRSLIEHCVRRLAASGIHVVLATTTNVEDAALEAVAFRLGVDVFRGSVDDVLARFVAAATVFDLDPVIRATGDNPAVDIAAPARMLQALSDTGADYVREEGLPLGTCVEGITRGALRRASVEASAPADREHVTTYVRQHSQQFTTVTLQAPRHLRRSDLRLTVDTHDDLSRVRTVFARAEHDMPDLRVLIDAAEHLEAA